MGVHRTLWLFRLGRGIRLGQLRHDPRGIRPSLSGDQEGVRAASADSHRIRMYSLQYPLGLHLRHGSRHRRPRIHQDPLRHGYSIRALPDSHLHGSRGDDGLRTAHREPEDLPPRRRRPAGNLRRPHRGAGDQLHSGNQLHPARRSGDRHHRRSGRTDGDLRHQPPGSEPSRTDRRGRVQLHGPCSDHPAPDHAGADHGRGTEDQDEAAATRL